MGAYYAYNTSNGYKVDTRSWYKVFELQLKEIHFKLNV